MDDRQLSGMLIKRGAISLPELKELEELATEKGQTLKDVLFNENKISEDELVTMLSEHYKVPVMDIGDLELDKDIAGVISRQVAERYCVIPVSRIGSTLTIAMSDPSNMNAIDDIRFLTDYNVEVIVATETDIREAIDKYYDEAEKDEPVSKKRDFKLDMEALIADADTVEIAETEDLAPTLEESLTESAEAPVVKLVNMILLDAIRKKASDIHVEPYEKSFRVRLRIDGTLYDTIHPPIHMKDYLVARFKVMANLDIAEKRVPQDGRIKIKLGKGEEMDFRVSVLPTIFGEKVVLRLLDKSNLQLDMTKLGFFQEQLEVFKEAIHKPYGMVLVTGPTGSGKTTTLYSALSELNEVGTNISTAEDPVEFNLEGINQVPIRDAVGLTFAASLRSFLRQDPDIIMVGEIRDFETGEIAVKAALTGHMVLSTLHTNDAPATITRLLNMGIESFLVTASLNCIVAQRLGRKLCPECKKETSMTKEQLLELGATEDMLENGYTIYEKNYDGCDYCSGRGYKGRIAFYEVLKMTDVVKEAVLNGASAIELKQVAMEDGMLTMRQSAVKVMLEGTTDLAEVVRNTAPDK